MSVHEVQLSFPSVLLHSQHSVPQEEHWYHRKGVELPPCVCTPSATQEVTAFSGKGSSESQAILLLWAGFIAKLLQGKQIVLWKLMLCQAEHAAVLQQVSAVMLPWREDMTESRVV